MLKHVFDGTAENFQQLVVDNSRKGAVLVNYWSPGAGPCLRLWQVLEELSQAYAGRFLLVNINTESQGRLARENGITSVPTIKIYSDGAVVESVYGAQSAQALRTSIDRHVAPDATGAIATAIGHYQAGRISEALAVLAEASREQPDDIKPYATALKLLLREKRYADINTCYAAMPASVRRQGEINALQVHARMLELAGTAPPLETLEQQLEAAPDTPDTLLQRAALAMVGDDYARALEVLLHLLAVDRHYEDELARRAMLVIFTLLGERHTLTLSYQKRMRELLH